MFEHAELTQSTTDQQLITKTRQIATLLSEGKTHAEIVSLHPGTTKDDTDLGQWFLDNIDF